MSSAEEKYEQFSNKMKNLDKYIYRNRIHDIGGPNEMLKCPLNSLVYK